jgi:HPt (histidine-containing phosphotransfer) domain-containing protein
MPSPIDKTVFESLKELDEDNAGFLREVIETFLEHSRPQLDALREATGVGDATRIERSAHKLKGGCGAIGAYPLMELCGQLELAARESSLADAGERFLTVEAEFQLVVAALERELRAHGDD